MRGRADDQQHADLAARLEAAAQMPVSELRAAWRQAWRWYDPPAKISREVLLLSLSWKLQEKTLGGLSSTQLRRLKALAKDSGTKDGAGKPAQIHLKPGARLIREWQGQMHQVTVLEDGFEWKGRSYRSLSAIARAITGTRWSGPAFFGLRGGGLLPTKRPAA